MPTKGDCMKFFNNGWDLALEDEFDIEISDDAAQNIKTVKDIVTHIEEQVK